MYTLLAVSEPAMEGGLFSKFSGDDLMIIIFLGLSALVGIVAIIGYFWWEHRRTEMESALKQAELDAGLKRTEVEARLKQDMLNRGFSADDIDRVLKATLAEAPIADSRHAGRAG